MSPAPAPLVASLRLDDPARSAPHCARRRGAGVAILIRILTLEAAILAESYVSGARHGSYSHAPSQVNEMPVGLQLTCAQAVHAQPIRAEPVSDSRAGPSESRSLAVHFDVSVILHQPWYSDEIESWVLMRQQPRMERRSLGHHGSARLAQWD